MVDYFGLKTGFNRKSWVWRFMQKNRTTTFLSYGVAAEFDKQTVFFLYIPYFMTKLWHKQQASLLKSSPAKKMKDLIFWVRRHQIAGQGLMVLE